MAAGEPACYRATTIRRDDRKTEAQNALVQVVCAYGTPCYDSKG